eukprot:1359798-Ditylum_brightwellii.AAC.1
MTKELIKKKEEALGNMSCAENIKTQNGLRTLDGNIRGSGTKKFITAFLTHCNGVVHTVDQDEVKVSEVKVTNRAKKAKKEESTIAHSYTCGTDLWKHVA